ISWWQRIAVAADLVLVWTLWPSVARGEMSWITWNDLRDRKIAVAALLSLVPLLLVFTIATFPGELLDKYVPSAPFVPTNWPSLKPKTIEANGKIEPQEPTSAARREEDAGKGESKTLEQGLSVTVLWKSMQWTSPHQLLVEGAVDFTTR